MIKRASWPLTPRGEPGRLPSIWLALNTSANFKHLGWGTMGSAHAVTPAPAATIDRLGTVLDNLALTVAKDTTFLMQLMASNLAFSSLVTTLTAANKKLAEVLAKAKPTSSLAATLVAPRPVQSTNTHFPGNYCWMQGHQCSQHHTSATCCNKAAGHKDDTTAANTMGGSKANKGWNTPSDGVG
jgi:hypothetical protein